MMMLNLDNLTDRAKDNILAILALRPGACYTAAGDLDVDAARIVLRVLAVHQQRAIAETTAAIVLPSQLCGHDAEMNARAESGQVIALAGGEKKRGLRR